MKKKVPFIVALIVIVLFSFAYSHTDKTHLIYNNNVNTATYTAIGILTGENTISQEFVSEEDTLTGFSIKCGTSGNYGPCTVTVSVKDAETGETLATCNEAGENIKPRKMHSFSIDPITGVKGKSLILEISEKDTDPENGIIVYYQENSDIEDKVLLNGSELNGVFVMKTLTYRFDVETFIILLLSLLFIWAFLWFLHRLFNLNDHSKQNKRKPRYEVYIKAPLNKNMGDDLLVEEVMRRYPSTTFYFMSNEGYMQRYDSVTNCKVLNSTSVDFKTRTEEAVKDGFADLNEYLIKKSTAVVRLGTTLYTQRTDDYSDALNEEKYLSDNSQNIYAIGTDFGPYKDKKYLNEYKSIFRKFAGISLRDSADKDLFSDLDNVTFAPDPLFLLRPSLLMDKIPKAIVSPMMPANHPGCENLAEYVDQYAEFYKNMMQTLLKNGYFIFLVSFSQPEADDTMMQTILDKLTENERKQIACMAYTNNAEPVLREFSDASLVIGSRYHSIVLGLTYNCKVLPVVFNNRTRHMIRDIDYPLSVDIEQLKDKQPDTDALFEELINLERFDLTEIRAKAEKQYAALDKLLRK